MVGLDKEPLQVLCMETNRSSSSSSSCSSS